jgi:hypothetical protein
LNVKIEAFAEHFVLVLQEKSEARQWMHGNHFKNKVRHLQGAHPQGSFWCTADVQDLHSEGGCGGLGKEN